MSNLTSKNDLTLRETGSGRHVGRELSESEIDRVAGAGCTFWDSQFGRVFHPSYPESE